MAATSIALPGDAAPPAVVAAIDKAKVVRKPRARISTTAMRAARKPRPAALVAGNRVGPWRAEYELGRGGMASVYAVTHTAFGKRAALKLAHREVLADLPRDTFLREARVVHLVDHPGVPDVFATGSYDTRPYLVMERLTGVTLGQRVDAGTLERPEGIAILRELGEIVARAHSVGVVHRDLKLDNVFLERTPAGADRIRLLDWGVARILAEPDPLRGMIAGTLTYVAPEQILGDNLSPASDVYSLGVLAYHVLLGAPPFRADTDLDLIRMHLHDAPPSPTSMWPDIPPDLAQLMLAMLAKDPAARPTVHDMMRTLDGQIARPPRRRWGRAVASAAVALAGALAALVS